MDRLLPIGAMLCFLASFGYTLYALGAGRFRPGRFNLAAILAGFGFQTAFLYLRGKAEGSCPLNSLFDVLLFLSWSLVLIYLLIGPAYRLSLLGAFTAPVAFLLNLAALTLPLNQAPVRRAVLNPWIETHAALSIVAYGAFGLAGIAGVMYLLQERQLKAHRASALLFNLPPINDLASAIGRLIALGFGLLTISFAAGLFSHLPVNSLKFSASAAIWLIYGGVLAARHFRYLSPRRTAGWAIGVFTVALLILPGIQHLSARP